MKKLILAVTLLALSAGITMGADMIAGNPKNGANVVGEVTVERVGDTLEVTYTITNLDWIITETHLHVGTSPADFPKWPKDPPPGQFAHSSSHEVSDNMQVVTLTVQLADIFPGGIPTELPTLFIAAHAVVGTLCPCDSEPCEELDLPSEVMVSVLWAGDFDPDRLDSYFLATIFGGTDLDGDYDAYCVDTDRSIRPPTYVHRGTPMQAFVYCECDDVPVLVDPDNPLIENCGNIGKVYWILNNVSVGQDIDEINPDNTCDDPGLITMGDIQRAIWELLDDDLETSGLLDWDQCRVDEIIAAAEADEEANGEFMPICGEEIGIIILPYVYMIDTSDPADGIPDEVLVDPDTVVPPPEPPATEPPAYQGDPRYDDLPAEAVLVWVQPIIIKIPVPCCFCDETAWAGTVVDPATDAWPDEDSDGYKYEFPGKNWAMFFTYPEDAVYAPVVTRGKKK